MLNVYLAQVNHKYGNNVFVPYSVGLLQAYAQTVQLIQEKIEFKPLIFLRSNPDSLAEALERPAVVGLSCYVWNWEWNKAFARAVRRYAPDCLVVMGGPHVPNRSESFFHTHPYVDLLVHYEGELAFTEILLESLNETPNYLGIEGISVRLEDDTTAQTPPRKRLVEVDSVPSPYLAGVFDDLLREPYEFNCNQETHRGCPYSCSFCDWGSAVFTKVRAFSDERVVKDYEWFGKNKIDLLYNCDANFGLFPRDVGLTKKLVETKIKFGFPKQFRASYAKNSDKKVFELAKLLNDAGMSKGATMSFQSMNAETLKAVKRTNIKTNDFSELLKQYHKEKIATFSELIMALPGETYDSFAEGIGQLLDAGQHDSLNIYVCSVLPNSELGEPSYAEKYGVKSVRSPVSLQHSSPTDDQVVEYSEIVVETGSMPRDSFLKAYLFSWAVQCFHSLALTRFLAIFVHDQFGYSYRSFYEELLDFAQSNESLVIRRQYELMRKHVTAAMEGGDWEMLQSEFGDIKWPTEEAAFLNLIKDNDGLYVEIHQFMAKLVGARLWTIEEQLLGDLVNYQKGMMIDPSTPRVSKITLEYDFPMYFANQLIGSPTPLAKKSSVLHLESDLSFGGDKKKYAQEVVWYGRKMGRQVQKGGVAEPVR